MISRRRRRKLDRLTREAAVWDAAGLPLVESMARHPAGKRISDENRAVIATGYAKPPTSPATIGTGGPQP